MKRLGLATLVVLLVTSSGTAFAAWGVTWKGPRYSPTSGLAWYTPTYINYWGGHKLYSQTGAWGRHIYASTDWTYYDQNRLNSLYSYWQATNYQYVPTTIHFDDQAYGGGTHYSGLHATGWYYTNFPNPEYRSGDDDGDTRHEEIEVRWSPTFAAGGYNIEVEYWDPLYNDNTGVGNTGEVNVASYITTAIGWLRIGHQWMCKFYYPERDYLPWSFDCRA